MYVTRSMFKTLQKMVVSSSRTIDKMRTTILRHLRLRVVGLLDGAPEALEVLPNGVLEGAPTFRIRLTITRNN